MGFLAGTLVRNWLLLWPSCLKSWGGTSPLGVGIATLLVRGEVWDDREYANRLRLFQMKALVKVFYGWYRQALRNSKYRGLVILATLLYWVVPTDIAPDFIPMLGWLDDSIIATLFVSEVSQVLMEHLTRRKEETSELVSG
jgi:uncharacterized membrane protein YkvA (DUF1232 family)